MVATLGMTAMLLLGTLHHFCTPDVNISLKAAGA